MTIGQLKTHQMTSGQLMNSHQRRYVQMTTGQLTSVQVAVNQMTIGQ